MIFVDFFDNMTESQHPGPYKLWEPTLLALCAVIGLIAGSQLLGKSPSPAPDGLTSRQDKGRELNEIVRFIEEKYVDEVNTDALISSAVEALLKDLDPHSGYLSAEEVRDLNEKMEGHFEGIGIEFQRVLDTAIILYVSPGGPAAKAGLKMFDRIISANDSLLIGPELTEKAMISVLRGSKKSEVTMEVVRPGVDSLIRVSMIRAEIPLESVEGAYMITKEVGYIRINRFSAKTYKEFMDELENLVQKQQMKDLIIDVRQNPGGYLKEAVNILSQLFDEKDKLLVYTEGKNAPRAEYHTTGKPFYPVSNIVVLVDDGSASASEIVAGALQDHDRGIIIGTQTYGKGLVQEQYALSNGGALRLTVARYFTPSGRLIQKPYSNGDGVDGDEQQVIDTVQYYTSTGREVSGSGGITPDILVKPDFDWEDKRYGLLYDDVLEYAFHGYQSEAEYTSIDDLLKRFPAGELITQDMHRYYIGRGRTDYAIDSVFIAEDYRHVRMILMGMIGSSKFGHESWFPIMNADDPAVQKALEVIKDDRKITLKY